MQVVKTDMLRRVLGLGLCLLAAGGCANHVRYADEVREHETRELTRAVTRIAPREAVVGEPFTELSLSVDETVRTRHRETVVHLDEETPWRAENELWEVPEGLVAVPFFIAVRASNKMLLGLVPDDWISSGMDFGFAALNPALNVEEPNRVVGVEIGRKSRELEADLEEESRPLSGAPVVLTLAAGPSRSLTSDATGRVRADLLELVQGIPEPAPRVLHVEVAGEGVRAPTTLELPLSRSLRARLVRAARARAAAQVPGISPDAAAQALATLDELGFRESAVRLEHELRDREHADSVWLSRLDLALED
jgi:hypothetical protein